MAPIVGMPAQLVVQHMKDQLIAKFYGDDKSTGIVKSLENAQLGSMTLSGIAGLGAAAAFVSGAAIPAIAALTAVAYSGLAGGIVAKLAKDHQEAKFYQLREGLHVERLTGDAQQRPSDEGMKAAFEGDAGDWKSDAPSMLARVGARHDRLREVAQPLSDAVSP